MPAEEINGLSVTDFRKDDTIRIAYIGDSWAYEHQSIKSILDSIITINTGKPVLIQHAGLGGITSKDIYYNMFLNKNFRNVIEWRPDFCFISAGINDTNKKLGRKFYKENIRLIIKLLLNLDITPIILEIPYYDIIYTFKQMNLVTKLRSIRSMVVTRSSLDCINEYTEALDELIKVHHWTQKVIIIRRKCWNPKGYDGEKDIYTSDRMHINQIGYHKLDSCIATEIAKHLSIKKTTM